MHSDRIRNAMHALSEAGVVSWNAHSLFPLFDVRLIRPPPQGTLLVDDVAGMVLANEADFTMADGAGRAVVLRMEQL